MTLTPKSSRNALARCRSCTTRQISIHFHPQRFIDCGSSYLLLEHLFLLGWNVICIFNRLESDRCSLLVDTSNSPAKRANDCSKLLAANLPKKHPHKEQHKDEIIQPVDAVEHASKEVFGIELCDAVL